MNRKNSSLIVIISLIIAAAVIIFASVTLVRGEEIASFGDWTSSLTSDSIEYAEVSKYFDENKLGYVIPEEKYGELTDIFAGIKDENCFVRQISSENEDGYMLALHRDEKLWLFKAMNDGTVTLAFEDAVTGAYYGCRDALLTLESADLWNYIVTLADAQCKFDDNKSASTRIFALEMREIHRVHTKVDDIEPSEDTLIPLLIASMDNIVQTDEKLTYGYEICIDTLYYITNGEKIVLNAGTTEDYVRITYYVNDSLPQSFVVKDSELYQYIRGVFTREQAVDGSFAEYSEVIDQYMDNFIEQSNLTYGTGFTDFELCQFEPLNELSAFSRHYKRFIIDVALYTEDPMNVYDNESVWLDSDWRIRDYMKNILFFIETNGETVKYKFFPETSHINKSGGSFNYVAEQFDKTDDMIS